MATEIMINRIRGKPMSIMICAYERHPTRDVETDARGGSMKPSGGFDGRGCRDVVIRYGA